MPRRVCWKRYLDENVYELALQRLKQSYKMFEKIVVSFSGGKDSTVCLYLTLQVARELKQLPLEVVFFDEECIPPETEKYMKLVRKMDGVNLVWVAHPIAHRNGCSYDQPVWRPFDPECPEKWTRKPPPYSIKLPPPRKGRKLRERFGLQMMGVHEYFFRLYDTFKGGVGIIVGTRADESLSRYRSVVSKTKDNFISGCRFNTFVVKPIYDWSDKDVWYAIAKNKWPYNDAYDLIERSGLPAARSRLAPPFGEDCIASLGMYKAAWPQLWDKMIDRVDGARAAALYADTELYAFGGIDKLTDTWEETYKIYLSRHPKEVQVAIEKSVEQASRHYWHVWKRKIPETGGELNWRFFSMLAQRGDLKGRRLAQHGHANLKRGYLIGTRKTADGSE